MTDFYNNSRRTFIKNMAKAGVMLPFAGQLLGQGASAATTGYKNILFMYTPNGVHPEHWNPTQGTGPITTTNELSFALGSLSAWHNNIIVLKNIYVDIEPGGGGNGGGHTNAQLGCLTGDHSNDSAVSIDNLIAEKLSTQGVLSVGVRTGNITADGASVMVSKPRGVSNAARQPPNNNPFDVATKLNARVTATPPSPLQTKVYAAAVADMNDIEAVKLAADRQLKIDQHQAALVKMQNKQAEGTLLVPFDFSQTETIGLSELISTKTNKQALYDQFPLLCKAQINNVVAAFANGLHRVATLQLSTGNENPGRVIYNFTDSYSLAQMAKAQGIGTYLPAQTNEGDNASHGPSHSIDNCSFAGQMRWHNSLLAYTLQKLKDAGILEQTLVVMFSDEGNNNHDLSVGGMIVAGGTGGGLQMGRVIDCGSVAGGGTLKLYGDIARWMNAPTTEGPWKSGLI